MNDQNIFARIQAWSRHFPNLVIKILRGSALGLMFIPAFGGWMLAVSLVSKEKEPQLHHDVNHRNGDSSCATGPTQRPLLRRLLDPSAVQLKRLCRPTSHIIPLLSGILGLIYAFRAMETQHLSLSGTEDYKTSCPPGSRRTVTGAFVKLFAATVTTIGVHGHLNSLNGSTSWRFELFRALELFINPLASVFAFLGIVWYSFADLMRLSPGPWEKDTTMRYRFARLCGCYVKDRVPSDTGLRHPIALVGPHHLEPTLLKRDMRWGARLLVLVILFGQYFQAAILMTRRILSDTAAGVDYAMVFLVLSGLSALCRSFTISLLHVSWTLNVDVQPCTEPLCNLPGCLTLKQGQRLPCKTIRIMFLGHNVVLIPQTILYQIAGGFTQYSILVRLNYSLLSTIGSLYASRFAWRSTIMYASYAWGFWTPLAKDDPADSGHSAQNSSNHHGTESLPDPITQQSQSTRAEPFSICDALMTLALGIIGVFAIVWLFWLLILQLVWLIMPSVALYSRIATDIACWKRVDDTQPCPQLWKDGLEDELWWF